ncbi:MAG: zinc-binding dehydrogenase [Pseudomonadota bacterium]
MKTEGRIAVFEAINKPFTLRSFPLRPAKQGEVLVRIVMSTICRSDIHSWEGNRPNPCPGVLGHEIVGIVEQIGDGVGPDLRGQTIEVGDRITWTLFFRDGPNYYRDVLDLPQKAFGVRKYGHDSLDRDPPFLGGFADYCYILPGTGILKLPDDISDAEAAPLNCGIATMIAVTEAAEIGMGDCVVIQGLGLLGLFGCAMAKARGARLVIGLDNVPGRLSAAKRFGADKVLDVSAYDDDQLVAEIKAHCQPDGADGIIEVCGHASVIPVGLRCLRIGGRYTLAGLVSPNANVTIDANTIVNRLVTLRGVHNYHPRHLVQALDFVMANRERYPFGEIVDSQFSLDDVDKAFEHAAARAVLRAAVVP